jgi:16S rRNA (adenine1518-N6/adenine1519-N6)-dimethyltransferase
LIKAKKSLGQNFLSDPLTARRIIDSVGPQPGDLIIEIGPGTGALTRMLTKSAGWVLAVEIDSRLVNELRRAIVAANLAIIEADALDANWEDLIHTASLSWQSRTRRTDAPRVRVVANLPYYISTPIIERLIALRGRLFDLTLMLQKEVVERIASPPGSRDYGYLSVLVQYHCVARKFFEVPPSAFRPVPKVQSAILHLEVRERPAIAVTNEARFFAFVRAAFAQRRKTILNNLKAAMHTLHFSEEIDTALHIAGVEPQRRAETLSLEEFGALYRALFINDGAEEATIPLV